MKTRRDQKQRTIEIGWIFGVGEDLNRLELNDGGRSLGTGSHLGRSRGKPKLCQGSTAEHENS